MKQVFIAIIIMAVGYSCTQSQGSNSTVSFSLSEQTGNVEGLNFDLDEQLQKCQEQLRASVNIQTDITKHPRYIENGDSIWTEVPNGKLVWTSGFYPGILWYMYEATKDDYFKKEAEKRTEILEPFQYVTEHHDIGFMMFCSYGNGYRLNKNQAYKDILLQSAKSLTSRFNPKAGTIKSWSNKMHPRWKQHITIIDNMLNLELLFWAARNGGGEELKEIAKMHAETTMKNHFRDDYTSWHVLEYDSLTGEILNRHTKQGYSDNSRWARGQAWGIYGYIMTYRETGDKKFLDFAQKIADSYIKMLPEDYIPYWDFDAPDIPNEEKDASAAAITASALIEMSTLLKDEEKSHQYLSYAKKMLNTLSSRDYSGYGKTDSFLLHSTGAKPLGNEIDVALVYADYYYIEALLRMKKLSEHDKNNI
jgi:unsaturated chondroitin disaccharide hydrolase